MYSVDNQGQCYSLGANGFLADFDAWDEQVAQLMAMEDGLELRESHWRVIRCIRDFYQKLAVPPSPRVLSRSLGTQLLDGLPVTHQTFRDLFPLGGCRQACRLAGLPDYHCVGC